MSIDIPSIRHETKAELFPKVYSIVERVLKYVKENHGISEAAMCSMIPQELFNRVYSLTRNVMKHKEIIGAILKDTKLLEKVPLRPEAVEIMIYEMAIRKSSLFGESEGVLIMRKYKTDIENAFIKLKKIPLSSAANSSKTYFPLPRYARIHTIAISVDDALADLESNGYEQILYPSDISLNDYQALVVNLKIKQFLVDFHFKDMLVFASEECLTSLELYRKRKLYSQDKSHYVPVHVLSPEPGSVVIAAPCKSIYHLVSVMENKGTIYGIIGDAERYNRQMRNLDKSGYKMIQVDFKDFSYVNPNAHPYDSAKYILLEPECSRSGFLIQNNMHQIKAPSKEQLDKLALYQFNMLKHALSFPQVERIVYTTCSIREEENEFVVSEALKHYSDKFRLVPTMPEWPARDLQGYEHKGMFFRTTPREHLTNMIFVAVFERVVATEGTSEKVVIDQPGLKRKKMLKKNCLSESAGEASTSIVRKKKKFEKA